MFNFDCRRLPSDFEEILATARIFGISATYLLASVSRLDAAIKITHHRVGCVGVQLARKAKFFHSVFGQEHSLLAENPPIRSYDSAI